MSPVDLLFLSGVLVFAGLGGLSGAWLQVLNFVAMVAAWVVGRWLGLTLGAGLAARTGMPAVVGFAVVFSLTGLVLFAFISLGGRQLLKRLRGETPGPRERALGVLLAATKAGVGLYVVASLLAVVQGPVSRAGYGSLYKDSEVLTLSREFNLLSHVGLPVDALAQALDGVAAAQQQALVGLPYQQANNGDPTTRTEELPTGDPTQVGALAGGAGVGGLGTGPARQPGVPDPFAKLARDPRFASMARDPDLMEAVNRGDYVTVMEHPGVMELLSDPAIRAQVLEAVARGGHPVVLGE